MRVAVVTKQFPNSQERWLGHSAYQTLRVLATRCDMHVFYPEATYPSFLTPRSGRKAPLDRSWSPEGIDATYIPYSVMPLISRPLNGFAIARRLLPYVRSFAPDIVLSYFVYPDGYAAVRIAKALKVPVVVTAVGSDLNRIPDALCRRLVRNTLRDADFVSTVSQDLCETARLLGADPARSSAKLNGCDTAVFHPQDRAHARESLALEQDADIVVYVGRLDVRKGLVELIEAVAQLAPQRRKLRCYIIGDGSDRELLLKTVADHNMARHVTIVPACPSGQVAGWMAASDLVALPSYNEGCPNVVIEALAAGRPVVATNVGGIPELMNDTCGRMVPPRNVDALARALDDVLMETWDANDMSARLSRSWTEVSNELFAVLDQTLKNAASRAPAEPSVLQPSGPTLDSNQQFPQ